MRSKQQKARTEQRIEFRQWKRWRRERLEALLVGPYATSVQALLAFLKAMPSASALIEFVKDGPWQSTDADVRFEILALLDAAIVQRRERMGMPAFDDALPGQPANVFLILRAWLSGEFPV